MNNLSHPKKNYLNYLCATLGVKYFSPRPRKNGGSMPLSHAEDLHSQRPIYWRQRGQELKKNPDWKTVSNHTKVLFISQTTKDSDSLQSLFSEENWNMFQKMVSALDLNMENVVLWETNESDPNQIYAQLLELTETQKVILFFQNPLNEKNIYPLAQHLILETASPLHFQEQPELKKKVWNDFKKFKTDL